MSLTNLIKHIVDEIEVTSSFTFGLFIQKFKYMHNLPIRYLFTYYKKIRDTARLSYRPEIIEVRVNVFNATFNNISAISWRSVLLVKETGVPGKNIDLPQVTDKLYHIMLYRIPLTCVGFELKTLVLIVHR